MDSKPNIIKRFTDFNEQLELRKIQNLKNIAQIDADGNFIKYFGSFCAIGSLTAEDLRKNALDCLKLHDLIHLNNECLKILNLSKDLGCWHSLFSRQKNDYLIKYINEQIADKNNFRDIYLFLDKEFKEKLKSEADSNHSKLVLTVTFGLVITIITLAAFFITIAFASNSLLALIPFGPYLLTAISLHIAECFYKNNDEKLSKLRMDIAGVKDTKSPEKVLSLIYSESEDKVLSNTYSINHNTSDFYAGLFRSDSASEGYSDELLRETIYKSFAG